METFHQVTRSDSRSEECTYLDELASTVQGAVDIAAQHPRGRGVISGIRKVFLVTPEELREMLEKATRDGSLKGYDWLGGQHG